MIAYRIKITKNYIIIVSILLIFKELLLSINEFNYFLCGYLMLLFLNLKNLIFMHLWQNCAYAKCFEFYLMQACTAQNSLHKPYPKYGKAGQCTRRGNFRYILQKKSAKSTKSQIFLRVLFFMNSKCFSLSVN